MKILLRETGFTLIEIMVALLIMAGLSVLIGSSVRTGLDSRKKVQLQLSEESLLRDALRLIGSDVASAFHFRDYTVANYNKVLELRKKKAAQAAQPQAQTTTGANGAAIPPSTAPGQINSGAAPTQAPPDPLASATPLPIPNQLTGFVGSNEAMTFTVRNHVRRFIDAKESDIARVSYFLKSCRLNAKQQHFSSCLVRLEALNPTDQFPLSPADEDDAKGVVLANNITDFKLRYISAGQTEFVDSWDSTSTDGAKKDVFPDAVEITLGIHDKTNPASKPRLTTWLAPIRNSNNKEAAEKEAEQKAAAQGAPGNQTGGRQQ